MYKNVIFDLGNVIFGCSFEHAFNYWEKILQKDQIDFSFIFTDKLFNFEKGLISDQEYYQYVNIHLNNELTFNNFKMGWNSICDDIYDGVIPFLTKIRNKYKIIGITNTNKIHYEVWRIKYFEVIRLFHNIYSSCFIKMRKPEKRNL